MEKVLKLGSHLELVPRSRKLNDDDNGEEKRYTSSVHEIIDDETIVITNPTIQARLVPLHSGEKFDCFIFFNNKIYSCIIEVEKNTRDGNIRTVRVNLKTEIGKYERRKFFRLDISMDLRYLVLTADNSAQFKEAIKNGTLLQMPGFKPSKTVNISGGGVKFLCSEEIKKDSMLITNLAASIGETMKQYVFLGKILGVEEKIGLKGYYEHRMQFVDLNQEAREEFVKYIFEKERESLKQHR